ncbi:hypothetical protein C8R43DRAFT_1108096 [Mycena crocata]|nr:hypothetical protein C8R43DRAFT_1108096 [Mycena crocata]
MSDEFGGVDPASSKRNEMEEIFARLYPSLKAHGLKCLNQAGVMDATRISDGAQVVLKLVETVYADMWIPRYRPGCAEALSAHARAAPDRESGSQVVGVFDYDPKFETVGEVVGSIQQVLEGLVFLHSKNIAHRNISGQQHMPEDIVVDASRMIPGGCHFAWPWMSSDGRYYLSRSEDDEYALHINSRTEAGPIKYYFVGFRCLWPFEEEIPEFSETVPYDPFKLDVCSVGEMIKDVFFGDPASRPDAQEALNLFRDLVPTMGSEERAKPLRSAHRQTWEESDKASPISSVNSFQTENLGAHHGTAEDKEQE